VHEQAFGKTLAQTGVEMTSLCRDSEPTTCSESADSEKPIPVRTTESEVAEEVFFAQPSEEPSAPGGDVFDDRETGEGPLPLTPELIARRGRLRMIVSGLMVALCLFGVGVVARHRLARAHHANPGNRLVTSPLVVPSIDLSQGPPASAEVATVEQPAGEPTSFMEEGAAPVAQREARTTPSASVDDVAVGPADASTLKKQAARAIERKELGRGIELSRHAIDVDRRDAEIYLLLGAALQETGQWKQASQAFANCVRNASRGPVQECRVLAHQRSQDGADRE
jgi:hypothetical protein